MYSFPKIALCGLSNERFWLVLYYVKFRAQYTFDQMLVYYCIFKICWKIPLKFIYVSYYSHDTGNLKKKCRLTISHKSRVVKSLKLEENHENFLILLSYTFTRPFVNLFKLYQIHFVTEPFQMQQLVNILVLLKH